MKSNIPIIKKLTAGTWIVDAFTDKPFRGNPAAVCILESFPKDEILQQIAAIMDLPETAFLVENAPLDYQLRWFSPTVEVKLCGHATLAATYVLLRSDHIKDGDTVTYRTLSGDLKAAARNKKVELDFPSLPGEKAAPHAALKALGVEITACQRNRDNYLVEVKDYQTLLNCKPNFSKLVKLDAQGVIVTTATGVEGYDFASRYFAPSIGVNEDPVTGSAHCFLTPYWAEKLGKKQFHAYQASKGQGVLDVTLQGARVLIAGNCVTTLRGHTPAKHKKEEAA